MSGRSRGRPQPTSKDVAALAGVSQSTVSYVMSGKRIVAEETKKRVEDAITTLGYHPHAGARALRGRRTNVIALVVRLSETGSAGETVPFIDTIVEEARKRDFDVVIVTRDEGPAGLLRLAGRSICDAFVLMDIRAHDERVETAAGLGLPTVLIGQPEVTHGLDAVDADVERAAELLVDELAVTGHRHLTVIGYPGAMGPTTAWAAERFEEGARKHAATVGLEVRIVRPEQENWAGFEASSAQILAHAGDRLGIISRTPQATECLLYLARLNGLRPGQDISIVGHVTDSVAEGFAPQVTNVSPRPHAISRLAMQLLFEQLRGERPDGSVRLVPPHPPTRRGTTVDFRHHAAR